MNIRKVNKAIEEAARVHGITQTQAVAAIEDMICTVIEKAELENDVQTLMKWKEIPCKGEWPTAYELIDYLVKEVKEALSDN